VIVDLSTRETYIVVHAIRKKRRIMQPRGDRHSILGFLCEVIYRYYYNQEGDPI